MTTHHVELEDLKYTFLHGKPFLLNLNVTKQRDVLKPLFQEYKV